MTPTKIKVLVTVFALLTVTGIISAGCQSKPKSLGLVNTSTLPGRTFAEKKNNSAVVYLGSDKNSSGSSFGPRDISFEFEVLR